MDLLYEHMTNVRIINDYMFIYEKCTENYRLYELHWKFYFLCMIDDMKRRPAQRDGLSPTLLSKMLYLNNDIKSNPGQHKEAHYHKIVSWPIIKHDPNSSPYI